METTILEQVTAARDAVDFSAFTSHDVFCALEKQTLTPVDLAALLSPAAAPYLEPMAQRAKVLTATHFGNSVGLYTPLYIANFCVNHCVYCGFNCKNQIHRGKLTEEEIDHELSAIAKTGLKEILLLTGESKSQSNVAYIGRAVEIAKEYFTAIGIEVYPMDVEEYAYLHEKGADFVSVYQETYDQTRYQEVHLAGPKRNFAYRFNAQERALQGGMRGVCGGALLGLGDFRRDAYAGALHMSLLQKRYPHAEVSFSVPRLRPYKNNADNSPNDVHEPQLLQIMLALRIYMPFAGINISTRERAGFRDHVIGLCATKISAGVKTGVGGHEEEAKGDEQFQISDPRSVSDIHAMLLQRGLQPVYTDYLYGT
ncbi:2-iminoacetate synthase ThiH [Bianquea renquensis]|uniref:2-iminoacetate synthase ThiH n=1 Tax=Bianquea renquensis TaxID=2763661 RepID=A0A926DWA8_9FIRM|nr:2-iminoacetate synthase ThiH [Bianquea renquensis]MBC8544589.1 2-iminoacetate synthase ThiH [Bianquea renquensis]